MCYIFKDWFVLVKNKYKEISERLRILFFLIGCWKWKKILLYFLMIKEWMYVRKCRRYMDLRKKVKLVFFIYD